MPCLAVPSSKVQSREEPQQTMQNCSLRRLTRSELAWRAQPEMTNGVLKSMRASVSSRAGDAHPSAVPVSCATTTHHRSSAPADTSLIKITDTPQPLDQVLSLTRRREYIGQAFDRKTKLTAASATARSACWLSQPGGAAATVSSAAALARDEPVAWRIAILPAGTKRSPLLLTLLYAGDRVANATG